MTTLGGLPFEGSEIRVERESPHQGGLVGKTVPGDSFAHESALVGALSFDSDFRAFKREPPEGGHLFILYVGLRRWMRHRHAAYTVPLRLLPFWRQPGGLAPSAPTCSAVLRQH